MEISSHYYGLLAFLRAAGINRDTAHTIAHASQYVDDALADFITVKNPRRGISYEEFEERKAFADMASCQDYLRVRTLTYTSMILSTCAFHFVPGCKGENFSRKMRCKKNSPVIRRILDKAVKQKNPVAFGMLLHVYADTFAHQGFSGLISEVNDIAKLKWYNRYRVGFLERFFSFLKLILSKRFERFFDAVVPAYGHIQALSCPDEPYLNWSYRFDSGNWFWGLVGFSGKISNPERYREAFRKTLSYIAAYRRNNPQSSDRARRDLFEQCFNLLVHPASYRRKIRMWRAFMIRNGLFEKGDAALRYDASLWMKEAFSNYNPIFFSGRIIDDAVLSDGFERSNWYVWYKAAKKYKKDFLSACRANGLGISI